MQVETSPYYQFGYESAPYLDSSMSPPSSPVEYSMRSSSSTNPNQNQKLPVYESDKKEYSSYQEAIVDSVRTITLFGKNTYDPKMDNGYVRFEGRLGAGHFGSVFTFKKIEESSLKTLKVVGYSDQTDKWLRCGEHYGLGLSHPHLQAIEGVISHGRRGIQLDSDATKIDQDDQIMGVVAKHYEGSNLTKHIKNENPLHLDMAIQMAKQVGSALAYLHSQGRIHRDIKADNIIKSFDEHTFTLIDLGLLTTLEEAQNPKKRKVVVTGYSPAELYSQFDQKTDAFSLGITITELILGRRLLKVEDNTYRKRILTMTKENPEKSVLDLELTQEEKVSLKEQSPILYRTLNKLTMLSHEKRCTVEKALQTWEIIF